jgi:ubiquinone/menaquinone biosynthesis C-methylase UbiE
VQRNRRLVRAHLIDISVAGVDNLPYADASFDKALCVHVVYFWNDIGAAFRETSRILRPGGRAAFVLRIAANKAAVSTAPPDVYRFRSLDDLAAVMADAGLFCYKLGDEDERQSSILLMAEKSRAGSV